MHRTLIIIAALLLAGFTASSAVAHSRPTRVQRLEHQLRRYRKLDNRQRKQLKSFGQRLGVAQQQVSSLQGQLSAAQNQAAGLQSRLNSIPTPLSVAINAVRDEVTWAGGPNGPSNGDLVAKAAMDYTIGHVLTGIYAYTEAYYNEAPGGPDLMPYYAPVDQILGQQDGICLHAERVFATIVHAFGFEVRDIGFDYADWNGTTGAHSTAEVHYNGGWHFFDPTFGTFYQDTQGNVMSIADARAAEAAGTPPTTVKDNAAFVNLIESPPQPDQSTTWFELKPSTWVVYATEPY